MRVVHCDTRPARARRALAIAALVAFAASLTGGCASFTDRWDRPDPEERPLEAIADVFSYGLLAHPDAPRPTEARIVTLTAQGIAWEPLSDGDEERSRLSLRSLGFADITAIAYHEEQVFNRGVYPEAIFIYVRGHPKIVAAAGAVYQLPGEVEVPLGRPYISLRRRAPGSGRRLTAALATLGFRY